MTNTEQYRKEHEETDIQPDWSNKTILVVEDEKINFYYIKGALEDTRVNLIHADNGLAAIKHCKENPAIDLILMDIKMPVMTGYEATIKIKQIRPTIPVIAQTAYSYSGEKKKSIEAGCCDYLCKPITPEDLMHTLSKYLNY